VTLTIRPAGPQDAAAVAAIHNAGIDSGLATFETRPRTADETAARITATCPPYGFLVAEAGGAVVGWAATYPYSQREAYAGVAEFSIYLAAEARGRGHGHRLLAELLEAAEDAGLHKVTSRLFATNAASRRLCAAVGFREVGVHLRHARLHGTWRDVVVVERLLGAAAADLPSDDERI
jgi:L-amino acid N-acyltransferase YncA